MSTARRLGMSLVFLLLAVAIRPASGQPAGSLAGHVVDRQGQPLAGVEVIVTSEEQPDAEPRSTTTDAAGAFSFQNLPSGSYRVEYQRPDGPTEARHGIAVASGQTLDLKLVVGAPRPREALTPRVLPPQAATANDEGVATVPVFYATDRAPLPGAVLNYGSDRNPGGALSLGRFQVSIPRDHRLGQVERPTIWTFRREDPTRHLVIVDRKQEGYDEFYKDVREMVGRSKEKDAFVFIHGFNVTFEGAIYRTAQMAYDLGFDGAPILYSWPSQASLSPFAYTTDAATNDWTVAHLRWFLEDVANKSGATRVHLIAHSMGNKALVNALNRMDPAHTRRFAQIVLTAPDMDADTFVELAGAVKRSGQMATLYASANDLALLASKKLQTYRRAGDTRGGVVVVQGIDTIDVSDVDTNLVGHFYYGDNTSVLSDLFLLLNQGLSPAMRPRLRAAGAAASQYWKFIP